MEQETQVQAPVVTEERFIKKVTTFSKILAGILFVVLPIATLYIGYKSGADSVSNKDIQLPLPSASSNEINDVENGQILNTISIETHLNSIPQADGSSVFKDKRLFSFENNHFVITFSYPDDPRYVVQYWENRDTKKDMKSVQVRLMDSGSENGRVMTIYEQDAGYCLNSWCELEAKETIPTTHFTWEYLGGASYSDVGHTSTYPNLYRARNGDFTLYVVTTNPINLASESDIATKVFQSLNSKSKL